MNGRQALPPTSTADQIHAALAPLARAASTSVLLTDFDGTLSPIVDDPVSAYPIEGAAGVLAELAVRFATVAVVSGRPVSFLADRLPDAVGVRLVGLYGLERSTGGGEIVTDPRADRWRPVLTDVTDRLGTSAPPGVVVESKGLAVTVHWRRAPATQGWASRAVAAEEKRTGLEAHPGRMSVELRPPLPVDKGSVTEDLVAGHAGACFFGDDLGDLPAFAALDRASALGEIETVTVAVIDAESPADVTEAADLVVEGPVGALAVLRWLVQQTSIDATGQ